MEKYIKVPKGTTVKWKVSCDGYEPQSGTVIVNNNTTTEIQLRKYVDLSDYSYEITNNNEIRLTKYIGSDAIVTIPNV